MIPQFCGCVRALAASDAKGWGRAVVFLRQPKGGFFWARQDRVRILRVSIAVVLCGVAEHL